MSAAEDDDLRAFHDAERRHRRRRAPVFGAVGVGLIVASIAARHWAEGLEAIQAASYTQMAMPWYVLKATWGTIILGGVFVIAALVAAASTLGGRR